MQEVVGFHFVPSALFGCGFSSGYETRQTRMIAVVESTNALVSVVYFESLDGSEADSTADTDISSMPEDPGDEDGTLEEEEEIQQKPPLRYKFCFLCQARYNRLYISVQNCRKLVQQLQSGEVQQKYLPLRCQLPSGVNNSVLAAGRTLLMFRMNAQYTTLTNSLDRKDFFKW